MNSEEIIKYIDGEMNAADASEFESRLKNDAALNEAYLTHLAAFKSGHGMLEAEIRTYFEEEPSPDESPTKFKFSTPAMVIFVLLFALSAFIIYNVNKKSKENSASTQYAFNYKEPVWPVERGSTSLLSKAIGRHLQGHTNEAIELLKSDGLYDIYDKYWTAEMLMHDHRKEEAKILLKEISLIESHHFTQSQLNRISYLLTL